MVSSITVRRRHRAATPAGYAVNNTLKMILPKKKIKKVCPIIFCFAVQGGQHILRITASQVKIAILELIEVTCSIIFNTKNGGLCAGYNDRAIQWMCGSPESNQSAEGVGAVDVTFVVSIITYRKSVTLHQRVTSLRSSRSEFYPRNKNCPKRLTQSV